jgi:hypothetical protein
MLIKTMQLVIKCAEMVAKLARPTALFGVSEFVEMSQTRTTVIFGVAQSWRSR